MLNDAKVKLDPFLFYRTRIRDRSRERVEAYNFVGDNDGRSRSRQEADSYGAELARQVRAVTGTVIFCYYNLSQ